MVQLLHMLFIKISCQLGEANLLLNRIHVRDDTMRMAKSILHLMGLPVKLSIK